MMTLSNSKSIRESTDTVPIQEGIKDSLGNIKDSLTDFAKTPRKDGGLGIDTDSIQQSWKNGGVADKIATAGNTTSKVADALHDQINTSTRDMRVDGRSIVARATNSVKQCPIYVTQTIRATEAHLLSKLFEKVYVSFFQAALAQNPIITPEEANNLNFLKQYHTDIRESAKKLLNEYYEPIDDFDAMMQESIYCEHRLSDRCTAQFSVITREHCEKILTENARLMHEPLTGISYLYQEAEHIRGPLYQQNTNDDETTVTTDKPEGLNTTSSIITLTDKDIRDMVIDRMAADASARNIIRYSNMTAKDVDNEVDRTYPDNNTNKAERKKYRDNIIHKISDANKVIDDKVEDMKEDIKAGKFDNPENGYLKYNDKSGTYYKKSMSSTKSSARKDTVTTTKTTTQLQQMQVNQVPELLRQTDVKKINGMDPYMMKANFIIRDPETRSTTEVSYIIGIKTVMHLIYVQDLADELYELVTGNVKKLQKVRYKTGEIGWADYMFNIKGLKADASKNISYNKRWISTLKQLANYNRTRGSLLKDPLEFIAGTTPIPNATLILSQTDVTWLVNKTGIDLSQISNARRLAKSLFLISIAIVDPSAGSMRVFFPDRDSDWDVQSLASIDAEVAKTDNSNLMKELQKAVNR